MKWWGWILGVVFLAAGLIHDTLWGLLISIFR